MIFKTFTLLLIINHILKDNIVIGDYGCSSGIQQRSFGRSGSGGGFGFGVGGGFGAYGENGGGFGVQGGFGFGFGGSGYGDQQSPPPPQEQPALPERQWSNGGSPDNQMPYVPQQSDEEDIGPSANIRPQYPTGEQQQQRGVSSEDGLQVPPEEQPVISPNQVPDSGIPDQMPPPLPQSPPLNAPQISVMPPPNANNASDENLPAVAEAACDNPNLDRNAVDEMCSLPPEKGVGSDDLFRIYYNPIVQQCLPFSYSGKGGNANRFVSVKNCYEICMPAQPDIKNPIPATGVRTYLVPAPSSGSEQIAAPTRDMVVRQIPNPADPSKTLTIVQAAQYVMGGPGIAASIGAVIDDGSGITRIVPTLPPKVRIVQRMHHPQFMSPPAAQYFPAVDTECDNTIYVNSRRFNGYPGYGK